MSTPILWCGPKRKGRGTLACGWGKLSLTFYRIASARKCAVDDTSPACYHPANDCEPSIHCAALVVVALAGGQDIAF